ncbi:MAG: AGE family epimerase/isomerase [Candidatus Lokiarchaeota archaeon]|nr:AGE family epimerase/isomerase [Candidatus Lokiarchaeota archaeon]
MLNYVMELKLEELKTSLENELENLLKYWQEFTIDKEYGGFYGRIDSKNKIIPNSSKGLILNTRILWTFSAAYNFLKREELLKIADRAFNYIKKYFYDKENGGFFWEIDFQGNPINLRKQIYGQAFTIYSFSEYYKACGKDESLQFAKDLFLLVEKHSYDEENQGNIEALDNKWDQIEDIRLSKKDANEPKSMNTLLHLLESYTTLYSIWKDQTLYKKIEGLIHIFLDKIIDPNESHFNLFFDMDWTIKSSLISYGHDIEGSWLLTEAAEALGDENLLKKVQENAIKLVNNTIQKGIDNNSSLYYEYDKKSKKLDSDKHWWSQVEAMVGFANAWQITNKQEYIEKIFNFWEFIKKLFINREYGAWNAKINKDNLLIENEDIVNFWKTPYHNGRALIELLKRLT